MRIKKRGNRATKEKEKQIVSTRSSKRKRAEKPFPDKKVTKKQKTPVCVVKKAKRNAEKSDSDYQPTKKKKTAKKGSNGKRETTLTQSVLDQKRAVLSFFGKVRRVKKIEDGKKRQEALEAKELARQATLGEINECKEDMKDREKQHREEMEETKNYIQKMKHPLRAEEEMPLDE